MSESTKIVFRRTKSGFEDNDPVAWNDLAVIKAYDTAVRTKQDEMDEPEDDVSKSTGEVVWKRKSGVEVSVANDPPSKKNKKRKRRRPAKRKPTKPNDSKWQKGDACMAYYRDDGKYYHATIVRISPDGNCAIVHYTGYDEEDTLPVKDIYPEHFGNDDEDNYNADTPQSNFVSNSYKNRKRSRRHSFDEDHCPGPFMPSMNDLGPDVDDLRHAVNNKIATKEALSSMLVSWYMAGYQTGYYRGLTSSERK